MSHANDDLTYDDIFVLLCTTMQRTNTALANFDGTEFARSAAEELSLCGSLKQLPPNAWCSFGPELQSRLRRIARTRLGLMTSTKRTVATLKAVLALVNGNLDTYEAF